MGPFCRSEGWGICITSLGFAASVLQSLARRSHRRPPLSLADSPSDRLFSAAAAWAGPSGCSPAVSGPSQWRSGAGVGQAPASRRPNSCPTPLSLPGRYSLHAQGRLTGLHPGHTGPAEGVALSKGWGLWLRRRKCQSPPSTITKVPPGDHGIKQRPSLR